MPEWLIPGLAEGFFMAVVKLFGHAGMGKFVPTIPHVLFAVGLVGLMQTSVALAVLFAHRRREPYRVNRYNYDTEIGLVDR